MKKTMLLLCLFITTTLSIFAVSSFGWDYYPMKWPDDKAHILLQMDDAFDYQAWMALKEWNNAGVHRFRFTSEYSNYMDPCDLSDGFVVVAWDDFSDGVCNSGEKLVDAAGLCVTSWWTETKIYKDAYVLFNSAMRWDNDPTCGCEYGEPLDFKSAAVHEFGHLWGAKHSNTLSVMYPYDHCHRGKLYADDKACIRNKYSIPTKYQDEELVDDITSIYYKYDLGLKCLDLPKREVHPGRQLSIETTNENHGLVTRDFESAFYLSKDTDIEPTDIFLGSKEVSIQREFTKTYTVKVSVPPDLDPGELWLGEIVDYKDEIEEVDESNNERLFSDPITILGVEITSPIAGDEFCAGALIEIKWDCNYNDGLLDIWYRKNWSDPMGWLPIAFGIPSWRKGIVWAIPQDIITTNYAQIRIFDQEIVNNYYSSPFRIKMQTIGIFRPKDSDIWIGGTTEFIKWKSYCFQNAVRIDFSTDGGSSWNQITSATPNDGEREWVVPAGIKSNNCLIRIEDRVDSYPSSISPKPFTILQPEVTVISPNGGEGWFVEKPYYIEWTSIGPTENVNIYLSTNSGLSWIPIVTSTPNNGRYKWTIPVMPTTKNARIMVYDADGSLYDVSDADFSIYNESIELVFPNGGEHFCPDSKITILWESKGIDNVKLGYSFISGGYQTITESTPSDGSFEWTIPDNPAPYFYLWVEDVDGLPSDVSDGSFEILNSLETRVLSPNGGEVLCAGNPYDITWISCRPVENVRIDWSSDGGVLYNPVVWNTPNDGSYTWTVPFICTNQAMVMVSATDLSFYDLSDDYFTIASCRIQEHFPEFARASMPTKFNLGQNYPNPFNPMCEIEYALPQDCQVDLSIYNVLGQKVRILINEYQVAGYKSVEWDGKDDQGKDLGSGVYFYKIQAGNFVMTKKMVMLK